MSVSGDSNKCAKDVYGITDIIPCTECYLKVYVNKFLVSVTWEYKAEGLILQDYRAVILICSIGVIFFSCIVMGFSCIVSAHILWAFITYTCVLKNQYWFLSPESGFLLSLLVRIKDLLGVLYVLTSLYYWLLLYHLSRFPSYSYNLDGLLWISH